MSHTRPINSAIGSRSGVGGGGGGGSRQSAGGIFSEEKTKCPPGVSKLEIDYAVSLQVSFVTATYCNTLRCAFVCACVC